MHYTLLRCFPEWFDSPLSSGLMERQEKPVLWTFLCQPPGQGYRSDRSVDDRLTEGAGHGADA
jgi:hypothetical protein